MKRFWQLLVLGYLTCGVSATIFAQSLGLNFAATDPDAATSSLSATDSAGAAPQMNWNNLETNVGTDVGGLVLDDGTGSGATVSWTSNNTWRSTDTGNNMFPTGGDRTLMAGYLDTLNTTEGGITITVDNIDAGLSSHYDLLVYMLGDSTENRGGGYTATDSSGDHVQYGSTLANPTAHVLDPGTDPDLSQDGTFLAFLGMSGSSLTLASDTTLTTPNGFRAPINGIQIINSTPGDVTGEGTVDINDFNVIRDHLFDTVSPHTDGDLNYDGIVDFFDFRYWKNNAPPAVAASVSLSDLTVPEPASALVLAIGAALGAFAMRRDVRNAFRSTR